MKSKTMILLLLAAGCGLVASYMTSRLLAERNERVAVLVAKAKFPQWTPVKNPDEMFELEERPKVDVPRNAVLKGDTIKDHVLLKNMEKGDVVVSDFLQSRDKATLDVVLPQGKRAVAIRTAQEDVAGGFVLPDSHVDVIHTLRRGDRGPESRVILQDIKVLAVDLLDRKPEDKGGVVPATVTLEVDLDEVQVIARAQTEGKITLALRPKNDTVKVDLTPPAPPAPPPAPKPEPVEVIVEKPAEPPPPPVERKTMVVQNGSQIIRATFTKTPEGEYRTDIERTQGEAPAPAAPPALPAPVPPPAPKDAGPGTGPGK
jgi:pilus assembly protein CpaB